jgi:DNA-binding response OmpR family regulator
MAPLFGDKIFRPQRDRPLVLIVEDDPDQSSILELNLKAERYDVVTAANGVEGLALLDTTTPDIIISDLMMPVMDGSEFVLKVKTDPRLFKIPILMFTAIADEDREFALLDLGADDYCDKTVQRRLLLKRIEKLVARPR